MTLKRTFALISLFYISTYFIFAVNFTVVIDPGHGGHDSGARGRKIKEKDINLAVGVELANMIKLNYPDVKVILTRNNDNFISLQNRADVANKSSADLFISIHTNSAKNRKAYGTETYVLGLHKTESNLDVAMRENSVILLENDYKSHYQDFNPNSIDSYIMFNFLQDKHLTKSLQLATEIEKQFEIGNRHSRGVRQAGFLVLNRTACPSVLVELGFVSNRTEEHYLGTTKGRKEMAENIYKAFKTYKYEHDKKVEQTKIDSKPNNTDYKVEEKQTNSKNNTTNREKIESNNNKITFRIQLFALDKRLKNNDIKLKNLKNVEYIVEKGKYKYMYGSEENFDKIVKLQKSISKKIPKTFIVAFKNGEKISVKDAIKESKQIKKKR